MTTSTTATRADRLPEGLCIIYAHGSIPGGLGWKYEDGGIVQIGESLDAMQWVIDPDRAPDHWGDSMVAIPRTLATTTKDPAIRAWAQSNINRTEN